MFEYNGRDRSLFNGVFFVRTSSFATIGSDGADASMSLATFSGNSMSMDDSITAQQDYKLKIKMHLYSTNTIYNQNMIP